MFLANLHFFFLVDKHSDKELREAEETILHHLSYCTQFKITESQLISTLRVSLLLSTNQLQIFQFNSIHLFQFILRRYR